MRRSELIRIANSAYNTTGIGHDCVKRSAKSGESEGCTLALFIARELTETFAPGEPSEDQLEEAIRVLTNGKDDLDTVIHALREKLSEVCHPLRRGRYYVDCIDGRFRGFSGGAQWNGFQCPLFTKPVADELLAAYNRYLVNNCFLPILATYNADEDCYLYPDTDGQGPMTIYPPIQVAWRTLYAIGNMAWAWQEAANG